MGSKGLSLAAPLGLVDVTSYFDGNNQLARGEIALAEVYDGLGRPDLAECVRGGKKYQRLFGSMASAPQLKELQALRNAFTGEIGKAESMEDWCVEAKERYKDDEGLKRVMVMAGRQGMH